MEKLYLVEGVLLNLNVHKDCGEHDRSRAPPKGAKAAP